MKSVSFEFAGCNLNALGSGALHWPDEDLLVVSDLHLGKALRPALSGGATLPPYETRETLARLEEDMNATGVRRVICLGDSFDATGLDELLPEDDLVWLMRLQAGIDWTWIAGNHDPGPISLGGTHRAVLPVGPLAFRHVASPDGVGEVSGHYHPKARLMLKGRVITRPCFLHDQSRLILPAFGAYTGGLRCDQKPLSSLMDESAKAILTGATPVQVPMPRLAPMLD